MNYEELNKQYENVPNELKQLKRWVCFKVEMRDGKLGKFPINSINGKYARSNDNSTWSSFKTALLGCVKYECNGIGFMLGDGIYGVDLDNHPNEVTGELELAQEDFEKLANEFITTLDSYSERSYSGNGVHIICAGKLPGTRRKTTCVEMYEYGRFFAFTGNVINAKPVMTREEEIKPLYDKYMPKEEDIPKRNIFEQSGNNIETQEIIDKACSNSKNGELFKALYYGDIEEGYRLSNNAWFDDSHSSADLAFCNLLAFWCNCDASKMDSIFRESGLMREKWDTKRGNDTYGNITIQKAISTCQNGYMSESNKPQITIGNKPFNIVNANKQIINNSEKKVALNREVEMNIDSNGEPIFRIKKIYKRFPCNDTGNAEKFYEYFGELFKYNKTDKIFMFWTGKTWIRDEKDIVRKYANKFIQICKEDLNALEEELENDRKTGKDIKLAEAYIKSYQKNIDRISNKAGKDAMLYEFQSLKDVAVTSDEFNKDDYLLNTDSGVVDLKTGKIHPFDSKLMLSKNTNVKVSYEEPKVWLKFLHGIFERGNNQETEEIIECIQKCLGYSLSGSTKEQCMFLCYGNGSNGKTTFQEIVNHIIGDYGDNVNSEILMQQKMQSGNSTFTIAKLKDARYVETDETDEGEKLAEGTVKRMTGSGQMSAAFKYANEFSFVPKFKIWMSTNNKPIIRGTDFGIWRRIFPFPFIHTFTEEEKDKELPEKLQAEADKILGWCIKGFQIYNDLKTIKKPECLENEVKEYQQDMDYVARFLSYECTLNPTSLIPCRDAYVAYKNWCIDNDVMRLNEIKFSRELQKRGFKIVANKQGVRCYQGFVTLLKF